MKWAGRNSKRKNPEETARGTGVQKGVEQRAAQSGAVAAL